MWHPVCLSYWVFLDCLQKGKYLTYVGKHATGRERKKETEEKIERRTGKKGRKCWKEEKTSHVRKKLQHVLQRLQQCYVLQRLHPCYVIYLFTDRLFTPPNHSETQRRYLGPAAQCFTYLIYFYFYL